MADVMKVAEELCKKDAFNEQDRYGNLLPCRKISPLEPFIKLEEYFMLERDTGKYFLYMAAIDRATEDIINSNHDIKELKCFVLGPGLGRLVRFCIEAARRCDIGVSVHVVEANPAAVEFLGKSFEKNIQDKIVHLYEPFIFHPELRICDLPSDLQEHCGSFDITVSELLGCFGDDEFLPELTSALYKLFPKPTTGIMIPDSWTNYLVPVSCPTTYDYLNTAQKSLSAGYTMGLPKDCVFLSNTKAAWTGDCKTLDMEYCCDLDFSLNRNNWTTLQRDRITTSCNCESQSEKQVDQSEAQDLMGRDDCHGNSKLSQSECEHLYVSKQFSQDFKLHVQDQNHDKKQNSLHHKTSSMAGTFIHGFIGYFTSFLYKDIMIETRHTSGKRNSFHWECYFVPLLKPVLVQNDTKVNLKLKRKCEECLKNGSCRGLKLWYEWQVLVEHKNNLESKNLSEFNEQKCMEILDNKATGLYVSLVHRNKNKVPKLSKEFDSKDSNSEDEDLLSKDDDCHSMVHKFALQNRNGECDTVFLTWKETSV